jgi:hypothetical protein
MLDFPYIGKAGQFLKLQRQRYPLKGFLKIRGREAFLGDNEFWLKKVIRPLWIVVIWYGVHRGFHPRPATLLSFGQRRQVSRCESRNFGGRFG